MDDLELDKRLKELAGGVEPLAGFEMRFWAKIEERKDRSPAARALDGVAEWAPVPSLAGAALVLIVAFLVGGLAGAWTGLKVGRQTQPADDIAFGYAAVEKMPPTLFSLVLR